MLTVSDILPLVFSVELNNKLASGTKSWVYCKLRGLQRIGRIKLIDHVGTCVEIPTYLGPNPTYPFTTLFTPLTWSCQDNSQGTESLRIEFSRNLVNTAIKFHDGQLFDLAQGHKLYIAKSYKYRLTETTQYSGSQIMAAYLKTVLAQVPLT